MNTSLDVTFAEKGVEILEMFLALAAAKQRLKVARQDQI